MTLFSVSGAILFFTSSILGIALFKFGKINLHRVWASFNIAVAIWGASCFFIGKEADPQKAIILWRISQIGVIFIAVFLYHVIYLMCNLKSRKFLILIYLQGVIFLFFSFTSLFYPSVRFAFSAFYYALPGPIYHVFTLTWFMIVFYSHYVLFLELRKSKGPKRNQILYFFLGSAIGFSGGITNFLVGYSINIYPLGNLTIPLYCGIVTYAIVRYRLMDITLIITRTGIFVAVYSLVLGVPFIVAYKSRNFFMGLLGANWWIAPLMLSTFLATTGPFIYLYIQRRAEDRLLREQKRYQQTLRRASMGMTRVRDLKKLLNLTVRIITRTVRLKHSSIYLLDPKGNEYQLQAIRGKMKGDLVFSVPVDSSLILKFKNEEEAIVYEEVKQRVQDYKDEELAKLEAQLKKLNAAVVVSSFVENKLLGFIVLGEKASGQLYSQDDLTVFSVLASQAALAIENAQFYEEAKQTQAQLFHAEKMTTIGTMANGLSHQINNRLHALGLIAADTLDILKCAGEDPSKQEVKDIFSQIRHALDRIKVNVLQGGEVVRGLLKYSKTGQEGYSPINLDQVVTAAVEMAQYKVKLNQFDLIRDYPRDGLPKIKGNFTQLQEVFFNLIDNAFDAMMQRRDELKEPNYRGCLTISAEPLDGMLQIRIQDNAMGVKEEDVEKLFTPFFTTKFANKKGTGLGLFVIQKIVTSHNGKIDFTSEYKTGTMFTIELPIARK